MWSQPEDEDLKELGSKAVLFSSKVWFSLVQPEDEDLKELGSKAVLAKLRPRAQRADVRHLVRGVVVLQHFVF